MKEHKGPKPFAVVWRHGIDKYYLFNDFVCQNTGIVRSHRRFKTEGQSVHPDNQLSVQFYLAYEVRWRNHGMRDYLQELCEQNRLITLEDYRNFKTLNALQK